MRILAAAFLMTGLLFPYPWKGKIYRENGFKVVENRGEGIWGKQLASKVKFTRVLSLGKAEGKDFEIFSSWLGLAVDSEGEILILDRKRKRLLKFSPEGKPLWMTGKEGEGPGEFRYPISVSAGPGGTIWVVDAGRFIHRFSSEGKYQDTLTLDFWVEKVFFLKNGNLLLTLGLRGQHGLKAVFFNRKMKKISDFPYEYRYGPELPSGSLVMDKITLSEGRIFFALPDRYEVLIFKEDASPLFIIKRTMPFKPTTIKPMNGGVNIVTGDEVGPCFSLWGRFFVVFLQKIQKDGSYRSFLDFYSSDGRFLGSYPLGSSTFLKWVDKRGNFYFLQTYPFPRIYKSRVLIK